MIDALLAELAAARRSRTPCALVTVAATRGSAPRAAGSKMLVYADGAISGTIGGGKFESLARDEAVRVMREKQPFLKTYPLHESSPESFGAICGGEVTVLIEPQILSEAIFLIGGGHCAQAIARLAVECGLFVTALEERDDLAQMPPEVAVLREIAPPKFIRERSWQSDEAIVIVSRHHEIDRDALAAALQTTGAGYIGMIGSDRKVQRVFAQLKESGTRQEELNRVYAPIGLDIGADGPNEIAVSVIAEILAVLRQRSGAHLRRPPGV